MHYATLMTQGSLFVWYSSVTTPFYTRGKQITHNIVSQKVQSREMNLYPSDCRFTLHHCSVAPRLMGPQVPNQGKQAISALLTLKGNYRAQKTRFMKRHMIDWEIYSGELQKEFISLSLKNRNIWKYLLQAKCANCYI